MLPRAFPVASFALPRSCGGDSSTPVSDSYLIPAQSLRTEIIVRKSRFLTTVARTDSVESARATLASVRAEMPDANHHVYAFRVGFGKSVTEGMSDAGEPSGTAGPPTLAVLRGSGIGDIALVTTRYFGGAKLGTGGLVRAYTEAAQEALRQLSTERKVERRTIGLELPYSLYNIVKRLIAAHGGTIEDESFAAQVVILANFIEADLHCFLPILRDATSAQVEVVEF